LDDDLEWKVLYVGSAQDMTRDQILDEILVGPVPVGVNKFVLQADAPDPSQMAQEDLLGVTVVLVTCSYKEREFVRVGYYVNNEYHDPNAPAIPVQVTPVEQKPQLNADGTPVMNVDGTPAMEPVIPPTQPSIPNPVPLEHIQRQILADKPRVTKFPISWSEEAPQQNQQSGADGNNTNMDENEGTINNTAASMMAEASSMMMAPPAAPATTTVTPPGFNNDSSMMMQDDNTDDDATGIVSSTGVVSMPEESNMSHSYFGSNSNSATGGIAPMAE
jgi:histone chaperone ASF1